MTAEALPDNCVAHCHALRSGLVVTCRAITNQHTVGGNFQRGRAVVRLMREATVSTARSDARLPGYFFLYDPIVTGSTCNRIWPDGATGFEHTRVTRGAEWKDVRVLFVRES
jgi:hypothetical protein